MVVEGPRSADIEVVTGSDAVASIINHRRREAYIPCAVASVVGIRTRH